MKTEFVRFPTDDGLELQGLLFSPDEPTKKVVLWAHGMGGNFYESRLVEVLAKTCTESGWALASYNNRGHDQIADIPVVDGKEKYRRIGCAWEKFEDCRYDVKAGLDNLEEKGYETMVVAGHSLGCSKVVYYLVETKDARVSRLILASPSDMVGLTQEDEDARLELFQEAKDLVAIGNGKQLLSRQVWQWYHLSADTFLDFSTEGGAIDVFNLHSPEEPSVLAEITVPILAFYGTVDEGTALPPDKALAIIQQKAVACPAFHSQVFAGAPHSYFGFEQAVAEHICNWLKE